MSKLFGCSSSHEQPRKKLDLDELIIEEIEKKINVCKSLPPSTFPPNYVLIVLDQTYEKINALFERLDAMLSRPLNVYLMSNAENINNVKVSDNKLKNVRFKRAITANRNEWFKLIQPNKLANTFPTATMTAKTREFMALMKEEAKSANMSELVNEKFGQVRAVTFDSREKLERGGELERTSLEEQRMKEEYERCLEKIGELSKRKSLLEERIEGLESERAKIREELDELEEKRRTIIDRVDEYTSKLKIMSNEMIEFESRLNASLGYLDTKAKKRRRLDQSLALLRQFVCTVELSEFKGIPKDIVSDLEESISI